jgi:2-dehydro-3-deoxy-D-arabinonate dehydratase
MATILTRHRKLGAACWALDGYYLPVDFALARALQEPAVELPAFLNSLRTNETAAGPILAPIEPDQEVWASGVTYLRSRQAREAESATADVYQRVYEAERPELFYKAAGWRVAGPGETIRIRRDSRWNVPEPELTLVANRDGEIVGYCAGNDVSSRDIEGENPLYLPQAKVYDGSCALGAGIVLASPDDLRGMKIDLCVLREGRTEFEGATDMGQMKRDPRELVSYLFRELSFPRGVFLMTGTGIVPGESFTLREGDVVRIRVGETTLENVTQK